MGYNPRGHVTVYVCVCVCVRLYDYFYGLFCLDTLLHS